MHVSWPWRRAVANKSSSALLMLICNWIHDATSSKQVERWDYNAMTSRGGHDPNIWVLLANRWACIPYSSIRRTRSAVYITNKMEPSTDPCGTPHRRRHMKDLASPNHTYGIRLHRWHWNYFILNNFQVFLCYISLNINNLLISLLHIMLVFIL